MASTMDDPSPSPSNTHKSNAPTKQSSSTIILDKIKSSIIERLTKLNPNKTLSPSQIDSIQLQLQHAFPSFHIPTHPTYSTMIEKAIQELKEEDGSSKEAISEYILANFEDLPWANNRFLSYYLDKLCKDGEVVCISSNRYSVPSLMDEFSKKKSLMMVDPREVDNLDGNAKNVDVSLFQEDGEEAEVVVKCRVKRKRNSLVAQHDEEEEVGRTGIVEGHDNVVENSEVPINYDEKVSDGRVEAKEKNGTNEEYHIAAVDKVQNVVAVEQGSQSAPPPNLEDEVKAGDSLLARDPCEGKSEQMVSPMDKTLPREHEEELRREALLSDHAISGATVTLVPSVSIEKLTYEPMNGPLAVVSVSGVDSAKDTSDKLVLERKDQDSCAADLKIVAVEKGSPKSAENREIVCCLFVPELEQPKPRHMFRSKKKSKRCQVGKPTTSATPTTVSPDFTEGPKMRHVYRPRKKSNMKLVPKLSESSMSETPLLSQHGHKSSAFGLNLMISSPSSHQSELMFMDDEDLNLPLQLVLKMHGKRRKSSHHAKVSKLAASSQDPTKKMPLKGKKMTRRKRKQEVLQYDGQKSCGSNDCEGHDGQVLQIASCTAAATSEKHDVGPPHEMQEDGQLGSSQVQVIADTFGFDDWNHKLGENEQIKGGHDLFHESGQYDGINRREPSQAEDENAPKVLEHPTENHQQQERPSERATSLILEEAATMVSPVQEITEGNKGRIANSPLESPSVKPSSPSHHDLEYNDISPGESSKVENENALNDLKHPIEHHQQQERPSEPATSLVVEEAASMVLPVSQWKIPEEENDGGNANPPIDPPSVKSSSPSHLDLEEDPLKQNGSDVQLQDLVPNLAISIKGKIPCSNQWSLQEKKEVKKIERRGMPPKNENENQDAAESLNSQNKQRKNDGCGWSPKQKEAIDIVVPMSLQEEQSKSDSGNSFEREASAEDVAASVSLNGRQQELSESSIHHKSNRITIEEQIVATKDVSVNLQDQRIEGPLEPATCKAKKKGRRGRPRKIKETITKDIPAPLDLFDMLQKELAETVVCQSEHKDGGENSTRPTTAIDEVAVISMHDQQQEGLSEQATIESREKEMTTEDMVDSLNFLEQQQEKTCKMNRGRPTKQIAAANTDVTTDLDLQDQEQKGSSVQATHQMKKEGRGMPPKSEVAEKSPLDLDQQEELSSKPAIHPSPDAFNVSCLPVDKLPATLEEPVSLRTRSKKGGAHKREAVETLLGSEADNQGEELVPILLDEESHQQEVVPKTDQEKKQWQSASENPEESEAEAHKSPSKPEQVTNFSDDGKLLVDQPCEIMGQHQDSMGKQLRSQTTVLKQKSCDHIPPSAIRRSQRINQRSQAGS